MADQALAHDWPVRAVVANCLDGEHHGFTARLVQRGVPFVVARKPSHRWWAAAGAIGAIWEAAAAGGWEDFPRPGAWLPVARSFRDGHAETWWALEGAAGPYGPERSCRLVIATPDPATLSEAATWYLATTLPRETAPVAEVVRLYGLRNWVEQAYKHTKGALGWSQYQVRSDAAIRRHWALVQCAFAFCWWAEAWPATAATGGAATDEAAGPAERGGKGGGRPGPAVALLAAGAAPGAGLAGAGLVPVPLLGGLVGAAPAGAPAGAAGLARGRSSPYAL